MIQCAVALANYKKLYLQTALSYSIVLLYEFFQYHKLCNTERVRLNIVFIFMLAVEVLGYNSGQYCSYIRFPYSASLY